MFLIFFPTYVVLFINYISTITEFEFQYGAMTVLVFYLIWAYFSIVYSKKRFLGPVNVDDITPEYASNGFEFWLFTMVFYSFLCIYTNLASYITYM